MSDAYETQCHRLRDELREANNRAYIAEEQAEALTERIKIVRALARDDAMSLQEKVREANSRADKAEARVKELDWCNKTADAIIDANKYVIRDKTEQVDRLARILSDVVAKYESMIHDKYDGTGSLDRLLDELKEAKAELHAYEMDKEINP